jgi:hypothetical protein
MIGPKNKNKVITGEIVTSPIPFEDKDAVSQTAQRIAEQITNLDLQTMLKKLIETSVGLNDIARLENLKITLTQTTGTASASYNKKTGTLSLALPRGKDGKDGVSPPALAAELTYSSNGNIIYHNIRADDSAFGEFDVSITTLDQYISNSVNNFMISAITAAISSTLSGITSTYATKTQVVNLESTLKAFIADLKNNLEGQLNNLRGGSIETFQSLWDSVETALINVENKIVAHLSDPNTHKAAFDYIETEITGMLSQINTLEAHYDHLNRDKQDKIYSAQENEIAIFNDKGNVESSGYTLERLLARIESAVMGNINEALYVDDVTIERNYLSYPYPLQLKADGIQFVHFSQDVKDLLAKIVDFDPNYFEINYSDVTLKDDSININKFFPTVRTTLERIKDPDFITIGLNASDNLQVIEGSITSKHLAKDVKDYYYNKLRELLKIIEDLEDEYEIFADFILYIKTNFDITEYKEFRIKLDADLANIYRILADLEDEIEYIKAAGIGGGGGGGAGGAGGVSQADFDKLVSRFDKYEKDMKDTLKDIIKMITDLEKEFASIISELEEFIEETNNNTLEIIKKLEYKVDDMEDELEVASAFNNDIDGRINEIHNVFTWLINDMIDRYNEFVSWRRYFEILTNNLDSNIKSLGLDLSNLEDDILGFDDRIIALDEDISSVGDRVTDNMVAIYEINTRITNLDTFDHSPTDNETYVRFNDAWTNSQNVHEFKSTVINPVIKDVAATIFQLEKFSPDWQTPCYVASNQADLDLMDDWDEMMRSWYNYGSLAVIVYSTDPQNPTGPEIKTELAIKKDFIGISQDIQDNLTYSTLNNKFNFNNGGGTRPFSLIDETTGLTMHLEATFNISPHDSQRQIIFVRNDVTDTDGNIIIRKEDIKYVEFRCYEVMQDSGYQDIFTTYVKDPGTGTITNNELIIPTDFSFFRPVITTAYNHKGYIRIQIDFDPADRIIPIDKPLYANLGQWSYFDYLEEFTITNTFWTENPNHNNPSEYEFTVMISTNANNHAEYKIINASAPEVLDYLKKAAIKITPFYDEIEYTEINKSFVQNYNFDANVYDYTTDGEADILLRKKDNTEYRVLPYKTIEDRFVNLENAYNGIPSNFSLGDDVFSYTISDSSGDYLTIYTSSPSEINIDQNNSEMDSNLNLRITAGNGIFNRTHKAKLKHWDYGTVIGSLEFEAFLGTTDYYQQTYQNQDSNNALEEGFIGWFLSKTYLVKLGNESINRGYSYYHMDDTGFFNNFTYSFQDDADKECTYNNFIRLGNVVTREKSALELTVDNSIHAFEVRSSEKTDGSPFEYINYQLVLEKDNSRFQYRDPRNTGDGLVVQKIDDLRKQIVSNTTSDSNATILTSFIEMDGYIFTFGWESANIVFLVGITHNTGLSISGKEIDEDGTITVFKDFTITATNYTRGINYLNKEGEVTVEYSISTEDFSLVNFFKRYKVYCSYYYRTTPSFKKIVQISVERI